MFPVRPTAPGALAIVAAFALTATLAAPSSARATVVLEVARPDMVRRSELVVRATVVDQHSQWNEDRSAIITITRLHVTNYLKGSGPAELLLRQMGGTVDGYTSVIDGDATLAVGQDIVAFLHDHGTGNVYLMALAQSLYVVLHTPGRPDVVRRDMHGLTFAHRVAGQMVLAPPAGEPDETLEHLVREVATMARGTP